MTRQQYLEQHHELTNAALAEVALMQSRGEHDDAATAVTSLRAMCDALWEQRVAEAEREVAP
jgi:hypothetical protein